MTKLETFIAIHDTDEWHDFWRDNHHATDLDEAQAYALACNQSLLMGGGAAPDFRIGFVD